MAAKDAPEKDNPEYRLIRDLAGLLDETGLSEIEIEKAGLKVRVARQLVASGTTPALANTAVAAMVAHPDGWYHLADQIQILRSNGTELIDVPSQRYVEVVPDELALTADSSTRRNLPNWAVPVGLTLLAVLVVRGLLEATRLIRLRRIAAGVVARDGLPAPQGAQLDKRRDDRRVSSTPPSRPRLERRRADRRDVGDHTTNGAEHTSSGHGSESPED